MNSKSSKRENDESDLLQPLQTTALSQNGSSFEDLTIDQKVQRIIERVGSHPGQGGIIEQFDKLLRKLQRAKLFKMIELVKDQEIIHPVSLYKVIEYKEKKVSCMFRFSLPSWKGFDEVFWHSLCYYICLALHRVTDIEFDSKRGTLRLFYLVKSEGRVRSQEEIRKIIEKIVFLVDREMLPTDFTRFRRIAEREGSLEGMSKEEATMIGLLVKFI